MLGNAFAVSYHIPGTATGNSTFTFLPYKACTLYHISATGSNANNATFTAWKNGSDTLLNKTNIDVGDSGTPAVADKDDFLNDEYPHLATGDTFTVVLDYDGSAGTAVQNFSIVITFLEG